MRAKKLGMGLTMAIAATLASPRADADIAPPPPDCTSDQVGTACTVEFYSSPSEEGVCMLGVDDEYYCRVEQTCYPVEQSGGNNAGEPCPAEATPAAPAEDDGESCAIRAVGGAAPVGALAAAAALAWVALRRRRRR